MSVTSYHSLVLSWRLPGHGGGRFQILAFALVFMALLIGDLVSRVPLPEAEQDQRVVVPERLARFIAERPRPLAPPQEDSRVQAAAPPPPPPVEREPTVRRERQPETPSAALTEPQRTARERAQSSGLLALQSELAAISNTGELSALVASGRGQGESNGAVMSSGHDISAITHRTAQRAGVSPGAYGSQLSATSLAQREITGIHSQLFIEEDRQDGSTELVNSAGTAARDGRRSREDVTITFDQHKGALYALYARERRRSPDLEGRIVLRITIAPSGEVTDVQVLSSELNSPSLESGIVARIKMFRFEAMDVDEMIVTYPIEFLPS